MKKKHKSSGHKVADILVKAKRHIAPKIYRIKFYCQPPRSQIVLVRQLKHKGMTFGPILANGHRSLIFVSDNNFNTKEKTQFLMFEVIKICL